MRDPEHVIETVDKIEISLQSVCTLMAALKKYHAIYSLFFRRREKREWVAFYLQGLSSSEMERKSMEPMVLIVEGADENVVRAIQ